MKIVRNIYPPIIFTPSLHNFQPSIQKYKTWNQRRFYKTGTLRIDKSRSTFDYRSILSVIKCLATFNFSPCNKTPSQWSTHKKKKKNHLQQRTSCFIIGNPEIVEPWLVHANKFSWITQSRFLAGTMMWSYCQLLFLVF